MPGSWIPDMSMYSKVIDFGLKANADNYIRAGWKLIETRTGLIGDKEAILTYRVGWPRNAGEPIYPPMIDEKPQATSSFSDPSAN